MSLSRDQQLVQESDGDEWVYTVERITWEQIEALNRLLAIRADEGIRLQWAEDEDA